MIEITKDRKSDCYTITKTTRVEGIDFHSQLSLSPEEMVELQKEIGKCNYPK